MADIPPGISYHLGRHIPGAAKGLSGPKGLTDRNLRRQWIIYDIGDSLTGSVGISPGMSRGIARSG